MSLPDADLIYTRIQNGCQFSCDTCSSFHNLYSQELPKCFQCKHWFSSMSRSPRPGQDLGSFQYFCLITQPCSKTEQKWALHFYCHPDKWEFSHLGAVVPSSANFALSSFKHFLPNHKGNEDGEHHSQECSAWS